MRILIVFFLWGVVRAEERSETFRIRVFGDSVKVISPGKWNPPFGIIIENKTNIRLLGKIKARSGHIVQYVSIKSGKTKVIPVNLKKRQSLFFVSLAPPFQRVELSTGKLAYEIPPKR